MKRPAINLWIILPLCLILFYSLVLTAWCFRDVFLTPAAIAHKHPDRFDRFYIYNLSLFIGTLITSLMCMATLPMILMKKRNRWVWYLVISILALVGCAEFKLGIKTASAFLIILCIAYFWYSPQNRLWYGVLYTRKK